jgi:hypothetical protein
MNIVNAAFKYLLDILQENCGVKVLVTDQPTLTMLSLAATRTELLSHEVLDTQSISSLSSVRVHPVVSSLKCVCVISPTRENLDLISAELATTPHYSRYSVYFTNTVLESQVRQLARSDRFALVDRVHELYLDFFPLHSSFFSLNCPSTLELRMNQSDVLVSRVADGLSAALSALQLRPAIRFSSSSPLPQTVARAVLERLGRSTSAPPSDNALLLILDRVCDPVCALLHPWFYAGAIHELFGIRNNLLQLPKGDTLVLNERGDAFLREFACRFLGDIGPAVAERMGQLRRLGETAGQPIQRPDQIADVIRAATEFQGDFSATKNHVAIIDAINDRDRKSVV